MVVLIIAVILALVFLTWTLCRAAAVGDAISERLSKSRSPNLLRRLIRLIGGSR